MNLADVYGQNTIYKILISLTKNQIFLYIYKCSQEKSQNYLIKPNYELIFINGDRCFNILSELAHNLTIFLMVFIA